MHTDHTNTIHGFSIVFIYPSPNTMDWTLKTCMQPNNGAAHDNYLSLSHIDDHEFFVRVHGKPHAYAFMLNN